MEVFKLIDVIETYFSVSLQEGWDNSGWQISPGDNNIKGVLLCLDVGLQSIREAEKDKCNLIITHHPLIFNSIKNINKNSYPGNVIYDTIKKGIGIYAFHTNLDKAKGGLNDFLCEFLDLENVKIIEDLQPIRIGELHKSMKLIETISYIKEHLGVNMVKYVGNNDDDIKKIAVCSGSCSDFIYKLNKDDFDLFVSGDLKHHTAFYADQMDINIVDVTHYYSEIVSKKLLEGIIRKHFNEIKVVCSLSDHLAWKYY